MYICMYMYTCTVHISVWPVHCGALILLNVSLPLPPSLLLSKQWGMLPCGHPLCMDCVLELTRRRQHYIDRLGGGDVRLSCPLCRFSFLSSEINAVRPCGVDDVDIKVSGVYNTIHTVFILYVCSTSICMRFWQYNIVLTGQPVHQDPGSDSNSVWYKERVTLSQDTGLLHCEFSYCIYTMYSTGTCMCMCVGLHVFLVEFESREERLFEVEIYFVCLYCAALMYVQWLEVLTLISTSLTENGISHFLKTSKTFQVPQ